MRYDEVGTCLGARFMEPTAHETKSGEISPIYRRWEGGVNSQFLGCFFFFFFILRVAGCCFLTGSLED